jgi:glucosamine-6-phosphate deaminase
VPRRALSVTVPTMMRCAKLVLSVPGARKQAAVKGALTGPVTTACPASILRTHADAWLFLDEDSAAGLLA